MHYTNKEDTDSARNRIFIYMDFMLDTGILYRKADFSMNYTYIVKCRDGSLYTGWTTDLERRIKEHNSGKGAKYTKSRRPVTLAYYETFDTKEEAMKREYAIKRLRRGDKLKLLENAENS